MTNQQPRQIASGMWHWKAAHPEWTPDEPWPQEVSSYAIDDGARVLLFDPLGVPNEILELTADLEPVIVLTCPWHERDTQSLVERLEASVYAPPPDTAEDLIDKFGITADQAGDGSPDLAWLRQAEATQWHPYEVGDRLPFGEAFPGREHNDMVLWIPHLGTIISGDTLVDFGDGFGIAKWLRAGVTREQVAEGLRPLLDLPVEHVLPTHGEPTHRAALERALS